MPAACRELTTRIFGTNDGGVVIHLGNLANVEVTGSERDLVRIGGGATWGQVAAALAPHGLAISSGDTKSVGVGGLTLTGGIGWKVRKCTVTGDDVALTPYADTLTDGATPPPGIQFVTRSAFADKESVSEVLQILTEAGASGRSPFIAVRSVGGAVSRVPGDATAYAHRQAELMVVTTTAGPKPAVQAARPALDAIWGKTRTPRQRRLRKLPRICHRGGCRRDLSNADLSAARGGQASLRPRQSVRPQPQRPAPVGRLDLAGPSARRAGTGIVGAWR